MKTQTSLALAVATAIGLGMAFAPVAQAQHSTHGHAQHEQSKSAAESDKHASHDHATHDQDAHAHADHHADAAVMPIPADHVKWKPDAPLMEGMRRMREAMAGLHHHQMGHLNDTQVDQLATQVDEAAAYMFANCKLEAEPDIALHGVLARLMAGAEALHANPADPAPVADMSAALADYPKLFDDPGFAASEEAEESDLGND
ncbi:DnrO protein [Lysobacter sp. H23M47]|uniref:DnrO protein n=1 Tax=Lysobacter sp. H23M47 TaxID=2781024 RepID=UPI00188137C8|nr:DnrO protein [Lysobacter sp. H23M47]QOW24198.1 DnrO protein [Lysobacter sp. H23M47]